MGETLGIARTVLSWRLRGWGLGSSLEADRAFRRMAIVLPLAAAVLWMILLRKIGGLDLRSFVLLALMAATVPLAGTSTAHRTGRLFQVNELFLSLAERARFVPALFGAFAAIGVALIWLPLAVGIPAGPLALAASVTITAIVASLIRPPVWGGETETVARGSDMVDVRVLPAWTRAVLPGFYDGRSLLTASLALLAGVAFGRAAGEGGGFVAAVGAGLAAAALASPDALLIGAFVHDGSPLWRKTLRPVLCATSLAATLALIASFLATGAASLLAATAAIVLVLLIASYRLTYAGRPGVAYRHGILLAGALVAIASLTSPLALLLSVLFVASLPILAARRVSPAP